LSNRYWVGGTGTWNGTSTTNWSASSGGASGASVPTLSDSVFFDANSNTGTAAFTVTLATATANCLDFDATAVDGVMTMAGAVNINIYGNFLLPATNFIRTYTGNTSFTAVTTGKTVDFNGTSWASNITFNGVGGGWTLSNPMITTGNIQLTNGSFNSNNKNVTCAVFNFNNVNIKTLTLGTSIVTITGGTSTTGFVGAANNTTYSVASSTIVFSNTGCFSGGISAPLGNQFGTITMSAAGGTLYLGTGATTLARCTILNNTVQPCTITNACTTSFTVDTFSVNGTAGNLVTLNSNTAGTARTINKTSGTTNAYYMNIQDSTATGGTWNAYNSTNSGNNTSWNFLSGNFLVFFV